MKTLTEVLAKSQLQVLVQRRNESSNARTVPYEEAYRATAGQPEETPVERLQRIAQSEDTGT